jgi:hypothetical protein
MNKLDLIIDALEDRVKDYSTDAYDLDYYSCCSADLDAGHAADCTLIKALDAARELRDMKPVGEIISEDLGKPFNAMQIRTHFYDFAPPIGTKLYTLGDANE